MAAPCLLHIDELHGWSKEQSDTRGTVYARAQDPSLPRRLAKAIDPRTGSEHIEKNLVRFFNHEREYSGGIWDTGEAVIAWADHIRSFPVYYAFHNGRLTIGNNARKIRDEVKPDTVCPVSATEFAMAGYVTGPHTLYTDLKVLQPGEILIWYEDMDRPLISRYFRYTPTPDDSQSAEDNRERLAAVIDEIFVRMIDRIGNRPIWIPLSAGLDSRLILAKLHEHGVRNIQTFTYGPRFNFEARYAKKVAARLNVPWTFLSFSKKHYRASFQNMRRKKYWEESDGLKAIPSMREYTAIEYLQKERLIPDEAIIINGQSGDYITGLHIAAEWFSRSTASRDNFHDILVRKHFDLWSSLKNAENTKTLERRIDEICRESKKESSAPEVWALREEIWEYDARQICLVVHGQRTYDYFGYDWEMPLWDRALVDFYQDVPLEQKKGQSLYRDYLRTWNYKGLFPQKEPKIWRWPMPMLWVIPAAKLIEITAGKAKKSEFYARMKYFGHYSNQYFFFPRKLHMKTALQARNVFSLYVLQWMHENKALRFPDAIRDVLPDIGEFYHE